MTDDKLDKIIEYWEEQLKDNRDTLKLFVGLSIIEATLEELKILRDRKRDIPDDEMWLFKDPDALASVLRGLSEAQQGRVSKVDLS